MMHQIQNINEETIEIIKRKPNGNSGVKKILTEIKIF